MEYMEGGSLADKLKDQKPLPDTSVLKYLMQILEGVGFIHRKGNIPQRYKALEHSLRLQKTT